jgi:hypothetical protein
MLREKLLLAVAAKVRALHDEQRHDKRLPENGVASRGFEDRFLKCFEVVHRDTNTTCTAALTRGMRVIVDDVSTSLPLCRNSMSCARWVSLPHIRKNGG